MSENLQMVPKTSSYKIITFLLIHYMVRLEYRLTLSVTNTIEILHVDKYDSNTLEYSEYLCIRLYITYSSEI